MKKEKTQKSSSADPCLKNVKRSGAAFCRAVETRTAHMYEKINVLLQNRDKTQFFSELPKQFPPLISSFSPEPDAASPLKDELDFTADSVHGYDGILTARYLRKTAGYGDIPSLYFSVYTEKTEGERIAYFKNPLADAAFSHFSKKMTSPSVSYVQDLHSVCEAVYYEKAPYGILPLYNSRDGRLSGFYGLVDKYELFVTSECSVYSSDNETVTRFALLSKHPHGEGAVTGKEVYFEFRIPHDGVTLSQLLSAAYCYGLENVSVDSLPADIKNADVLIFKGKGEAVCDMLFYMYCTDCQYTLIGVYEE